MRLSWQLTVEAVDPVDLNVVFSEIVLQEQASIMSCKDKELL